MTKSVIGIIGGYGRVGLECTKCLLETTVYNIIIGGRNKEKWEDLRKNMERRVSMQVVDVYDQYSLDNFCCKCDIVINCAGPSERIFDRVALAAMRHNIHYVDPSGNARLYKVLGDITAAIERKGLTFLLYAGLSPGLSGLFPAYMAKHHFDIVRSLDLFHVGGGEMTFNSAYDFIVSIDDGSTEAMVYYENGIRKKGIPPLNDITLPEPVGKVDAYPVFSQELMRVVESCRIKSARSYNAFIGTSTPRVLFEIGVSKQYETEEQKARSARLLMKALKEDILNKKPFFMIHLIMKGEKNGLYKKITSTLTFDDGYKALGIVVASSARLIINELSNGPGCFLLADTTNPSEFMALLEQQNIFCVQSSDT